MRRFMTCGILAVLSLGASCQDKTFKTERGFLWLNGQAVVPTGVYFWPDVSKPTGQNPFEDVASYGFDTLIAYYEYIRLDRTVTNQPDVNELRKECDRLGIHYFLGAPPKSVLTGKTDAQLESLFGALTDKVKDSPHYFGWCFDEPLWNGIDLALMKRCVAAIRKRAVPQVIYFIFAPLDGRWDDPDWPDMKTYAGLADIVGFNFYPVQTGLPWPGYIEKSQLQDFAWYVDRLRSWVGPDKPIWTHQQGFKKGDLENPPTSEGRRPDAVETRFMTFQAIAHGATGSFYFPGSRLGGVIPFKDPTWDVHIRQTAAAVRALRPALSSSESPETVTVSASDVRVLVRRLNGKLVMIAVRESDGSPKSVTFGLPRPMTLQVTGEGRSVAAPAGSFTDSFGRYAVHIYQEP